LLFAAALVPAILTAQRQGHAPAATPPAAPVRLVLAPAGNEARFVVREQLVANTIENDAVGTTTAITGTIVLDGHGKVDPTASRFMVTLDSLKSDKSMRDRFIKGRTMQTSQFPVATLVVKELQGLPAILPSSGSLALTLVGDLTFHGVTRPSTWSVTATADAAGFVGRAVTHFKFEDFNMTQPSVPVLASVRNDIMLQYDFHFVRSEGH
jgi:polyisoprenoid-binding protein YceI